jgi:hypothetical protein
MQNHPKVNQVRQELTSYIQITSLYLVSYILHPCDTTCSGENSDFLEYTHKTIVVLVVYI